jgi:N-acetylglucosaminyl-diphospho-decaprenol L-rhamnosyltransferase
VLTAIIVAYRTPAEVAAAVGSLHAQAVPPGEIIVVDNGAPDGDPVPRTPELANVHIEAPPRNAGFGGGCNIGARLASGDELLFLNADVVLTAHATEAMSRRLQSDPRIAAVGPLIYSRGEVQLSARAFPSLRTGLMGRRSMLTRLLVQARRYPAEFRHMYGEGGPVDWISGACMLVRRDAFDEIDGFDEQYWMYWEDADLCRRLTDRDWSVHFERAAVVHHASGASGTSYRTIRSFHESAARFACTHITGTALGCHLTRLALRWRNWLVLRRFARGDDVMRSVP